MSLFRKTNIEHMRAASQSAGLKKALGALDLTILRVCAIISTGIFVLTGTGAVQRARR
ncbi:amino acid transporter [Paraburkholderia sp. EB58]|jgi:APA family basic amino acid/polyamine antiporter